MRSHILWVTIALLPTLLTAQQGTLDPDFDGDGILELAAPINGFTQFWPRGMHVRSDMSILVTGSAKDSTGANVLVSFRILEDGTLDTTYGDSGFTATGPAFYEASYLRSDERLLIQGRRSLPQSTHLYALDHNGQPYSGFGLNGAVQFPSSIKQLTIGVLDPSDRLITCAKDSFEYDPRLVRLTGTGVLDTSFGGGDGLVPLVWACGDHRYSGAIRMADGRLVFIWDQMSCSPGDTDGWIRTFNADGTVFSEAELEDVGSVHLCSISDRGNGGYAISGWGTTYAQWKAHWFDADTLTNTYNFSSIVLPGPLFYTNAVFDGVIDGMGRFVQVGNVMLRTFQDGSLDPSFNGTGLVELSPYLGERVALQPDGKILVLAEAITGTKHLMRYHADLSTPVTGRAQSANGLLIYPNPAADGIQVELPADIGMKPWSITIRSLDGADVAPVAPASRGSGFSIDLGHLANGAYVLSAVREDGMILHGRVLKLD